MSHGKQLVRSSLVLALCIGALGVAAQASAFWVSVAKVTRVRQYASGTSVRVDIWFDTNVASGCAENDKASLVSTDPTFVQGIRDLAVAARLSGRDVEVNTLGCQGSYGKIDYLSLK